MITASALRPRLVPSEQPVRCVVGQHEGNDNYSGQKDSAGRLEGAPSRCRPDDRHGVALPERVLAPRLEAR